MQTPRSFDVIVVGAGHNGLVAALLLARAGLEVAVVEEKAQVGGATKTEYPFAQAPLLGTSTGAYLLGVMPPELLARLGVRLPLIPRDPHYFLPTTDQRYLLFGSDQTELQRQFLEFFSEADWQANLALGREIAQLRDDLAPSWLEEPLSAAETAERYIRPGLRQVFLDLVHKPLEEYLARFRFQSELLLAMYAVTDGFTGLSGSFGTPGAGLNFLAHNMCRLPGANGAWMMVRGGMGTVTREFAAAAVQAGARIFTHSPVAKIEVDSGVATGVLMTDGRQLRARAVLCNADPFRMLQLCDKAAFPAAFVERVQGMRRDGMSLKVNLALSALPRFRCLPENRGQFSSTMHLLPQAEDVAADGSILARLRRGFEGACRGQLDDFPAIEWYLHTEADPSLRDHKGNHNSAFFVQWVPYSLSGTTWEAEEARYVKHLLSIADRFAPGTSDLVVDTFALTPPKIESHFGISRGHIQHVDNSIGFDQRMPYATPVPGLYSCSAGCHPAGAVSGAAGHNAARRLLRDLGLL